MSTDIEVFKTKEMLLEKAIEHSTKGPTEFQDSIYLYFMARYFVSVFEAKFGAIPIQVWNEYRNSLDHFFRSMTSKDKSHIKKMQGHLQRALLDILKLYSHKVQIKVKELHSEIDINVLRLVDNGNFLVELNRNIKKSEDKLISAKVKDNSLGEDSHTNKEIVGSYLDAVYSFDNIYENIINKTDAIETARVNHQSISDKASKGEFYVHMKTHYIFYISWSILTWPIVAYAIPYLKSFFK